jgi:hypothetical protein
MRIIPAATLPPAMSIRAPCFLSTKDPRKGKKGRGSSLNNVIAENSVLEIPNSSLMGIRKNESPQPPIPAVIRLVMKTITTMYQP